MSSELLCSPRFRGFCRAFGFVRPFTRKIDDLVNTAKFRILALRVVFTYLTFRRHHILDSLVTLYSDKMKEWTVFFNAFWQKVSLSSAGFFRVDDLKIMTDAALVEKALAEVLEVGYDFFRILLTLSFYTLLGLLILMAPVRIWGSVYCKLFLICCEVLRKNSVWLSLLILFSRDRILS